MATEQDQDRNEAASPFKLMEARKRGQVARSADVVSAIVFCAAVAYLSMLGLPALEHQFRLDRLLLSQAGNLDSSSAVWVIQVVERGLMESILLRAPFMAALMAAAIVGNLSQTGGVFSFSPLAPDWKRLNPIDGLKRITSVRTIFDTLRAVVKLIVLAIVDFQALRVLTPQFHQLAAATPAVFLRLLLDDAASVGFKFGLGLLVIAAVDLAFTRGEFARKMRMSRREQKEENKQREGDPRVRARLRELRREILKRSLALRQTRSADLLITNPTHYAVALSYRHGEMAAPRILAKGTGTMAALMRGIAHRHAIPIVARPGLARALYAQSEIGANLPDEFFGEVARLMIWVITMRESRSTAAGIAS